MFMRYFNNTHAVTLSVLTVYVRLLLLHDSPTKLLSELRGTFLK